MATAAPHHGMELFQADSEDTAEDTGQPVRDIRQLYNDVFLPRMRAFLQQKERPSEEPKKKGGPAKVIQLCHAACMQLLDLVDADWAGLLAHSFLF